MGRRSTVRRVEEFTLFDRRRRALAGGIGRSCRAPARWVQRARRDLVLQTPFSTMHTTGTFVLRSPVRPNSIVELVAIDGATLQVRRLACLDGTPLIDLRPGRGATE